LLLLLVEQGLRRRQLEHLEAVTYVPAVRGGAEPQLALGFGEGDVETVLAVSGPLHQIMQGQRRLAGARCTLDEVEVAARQPADEDVVEAGNAELCLVGAGLADHW